MSKGKWFLFLLPFLFNVLSCKEEQKSEPAVALPSAPAAVTGKPAVDVPPPSAPAVEVPAPADKPAEAPTDKPKEEAPEEKPADKVDVPADKPADKPADGVPQDGLLKPAAPVDPGKPTMVLSGRMVLVSLVSQAAYGDTGAFQVQNLLDADTGSAWVEQAPGDGLNEGFELKFDQKYDVVRIEIWNGWQKTDAQGDKFAMYQRVQSLTFDSGDGVAHNIELADTRDPQSINVHPLSAEKLTFRIAGVYQAQQDETAISEIKVHVIRPDEAAAVAGAEPAAGPVPVEGVDRSVMTMVDIPAGTYTLGLGQDQVATTVELCLRGTAESKCEVDMFDDQEPQHTEYISGFYMDTTEVTNSQYMACVNAGMCQPANSFDKSDFDDPGQPVTGVNWMDAANYCAWANKRLPTEAEWEYAARRNHGGRYAWGNDKPTPERAVYCDEKCQKSGYSAEPDPNRRKGPEYVNSYQTGATADGLLNMSGNVAEWVYDRYEKNFFKSLNGSRDPRNDPRDMADRRLTKGGAWDMAPTYLDVRYRKIEAFDNRDNSIGFRCAADGRRPGMASIPGGSFTRGLTPEETKILVDDCFQDAEMKKCSFSFRFGDQTPQVDVTMNAYKIDKFPVTNNMYRACVDAGKCRKKGSLENAGFNAPDQPVTDIPWDDADNYCTFVGKRMCTEAEWEVAARGGDTSLFPWGTLEITPAYANFCGDECGRMPLKQRMDVYRPDQVLGRNKNVSKFGVYDMVGNVHCWVADRYVKDAYSKCGSKCTNLFNKPKSKSDKMVVRGGSLWDGESKTTATYRGYRNRTQTEPNVGFRCCQ